MKRGCQSLGAVTLTISFHLLISTGQLKHNVCRFFINELLENILIEGICRDECVKSLVLWPDFLRTYHDGQCTVYQGSLDFLAFGKFGIAQIHNRGAASSKCTYTCFIIRYFFAIPRENCVSNYDSSQLFAITN